MKNTFFFLALAIMASFLLTSCAETEVAPAATTTTTTQRTTTTVPDATTTTTRSTGY
jgi:outer membrane biogenesis lipoprotein LolB